MSGFCLHISGTEARKKALLQAFVYIYLAQKPEKERCYRSGLYAKIQIIFGKVYGSQAKGWGEFR